MGIFAGHFGGIAVTQMPSTPQKQIGPPDGAEAIRRANKYGSDYSAAAARTSFLRSIPRALAAPSP